MRYFTKITLLATFVFSVGCQREYISSDNPSFPLKQSQISTAKWTNQKLHNKSKAEKLKNLAPAEKVTD